MTPHLAAKLVQSLRLPPSVLPLPGRVVAERNDTLARSLSSLGYPAFAYLRAGAPRRNPAEVLLSALAMNDCEARLVEALPWLLLEFDLDSGWLARQARLHNLQNRFGFVVSLARQVAETNPRYHHRTADLRGLERDLEGSRLAAEDTLCNSSLGSAHRAWLRQARPPEAAAWNLLTDWRLEHLRYAA